MAKTNTLSGIVVYNSLKSPKFKFESTTRKEYGIEVVVDKATARAWDKLFKKQSSKVVDNEDFVKAFGMELPFPEQDEQFIIKVKRPADYEEKDKTTNVKTGRILPIPDKYRPRLLLLTDPKTRKCVDITFKEYGLGRGSKVLVQYEERDSGSFGTTARLLNVRVDELVKYEFGNTFDELGSVDELAENPYADGGTQASGTVTTSTPANTGGSGDAGEDDFFGDDED